MDTKTSFLDIKRSSHRLDKWDRLYGTLVNEDVHMIGITDTLLKTCGFEINIDEFVTIVSTNEVLKEIFEIRAKETLQIALIPNDLERFLAKGKGIRRRKN